MATTRYLLNALLLAVLLALAPGAPARSQTPGQVVTPANTLPARDAHTAALAGKLILIDIRTPEEWRQTGVPASGHAITMHQSQSGFLRELSAAGGSKTEPIALICAVGNRSAFLQDWLRRAGYSTVINVSEGMVGGPRGAGWIKAGLPVRKWRPGSVRPEASAQ